MDPTDEMLARAARAGDDDAFGTLFARYHPRLELYCRSILRHEEDARDAAQNAMAKALVALRRHDGELQVRPWLYRIAHNEAISLMRTRRHHAVLDEGLGSAAADPVDELLSRERLEQTFDSVRELPGEQREALLLRELMGLSHEEIGVAMGTTAVRAKHVVFRARAALTADASASDEDCSSIRRLLGDGDGRRRRSRVVRGHLRCCGPCRAWDDAHRPRARRRVIALPAALSSWLGAAIGGAGGGAGTAKVAASIVVVAATATPLAEDVARRPAAAAKAGATASAGAAPTPAFARVRPAVAATTTAATSTTAPAQTTPARATTVPTTTPTARPAATPATRETTTPTRSHHRDAPTSASEPDRTTAPEPTPRDQRDDARRSEHGDMPMAMTTRRDATHDTQPGGAEPSSAPEPSPAPVAEPAA